MDGPITPAPWDETARLAALEAFGVLDTPRESDFDDIAELAAAILDTPIAVVNFIASGRQWFKAEIGIGERELPLDVSICRHAILQPGVFVVPDLTKDERFIANPLVTPESGLRFYAGALLETEAGLPIGTLCVLDTRPRPQGISDHQRRTLEVLARQVMAQLELRRVAAAQQARTLALEASDRARTEAAAKLSESEAFLRLSINAASEAFYAVDRDGVTTLCNDAFLRLVGFKSRDDVIGRKLHSMIHHSHPDGTPYPVSDCPIYLAAASGRPAKVDDEVFFRLDGSTFPVEYRAEPIIIDGRPVGAICTFRDVTEQRAAEQALRRSEAHLRDLNETLERQVEIRTRERDRAWKGSRDLQAVLDQRGVIRSVNGAWTKVLGWTEDDLVGRNLREFILADDLNVGDAALALAAMGPPPPFETRLKHKRGGFQWLSWVAWPEDGLIYASGRQVTAEKLAAQELAAMQDQLRQSQKVEAVGQLTGGVAHDFNNLLTIIRSSVDFLQRPNLPEERRTRYISAISDTVDRAAKLTSQLLAFARRQPLKPEVFDVGEKVAGVVELVRTLVGGRIMINLKAPAGAAFVLADVGQFETALVNLAVNARDAMNGEGRLTIKVRPVAAIPALRNHPSRAGVFVAISVADLGGGIAPDKLQAIFEPFYTTKEVGKGTGLGLSQVFGFAKQSNGEVAVESTVGKGSTFTLYLPSVSAAADPATAPSLPAGADRRSGGASACVLVVEDNELVGQFCTEMLHDLGFKTTWASSAAEALHILGKSPGAFDLVFSDVVMPGLNGVAFAQKVRETYPALPVVLTSGYSEVLAAEGRHGFDLIQKPYSVEALSQILQAALRKGNDA